MSSSLRSDVRVTSETSQDTLDFGFAQVPTPATDDAAVGAVFKVVDGRADQNGGSLAVLNDGLIPRAADEPRSNFFYGVGTDGGLLEIDLGTSMDVSQVATYSWHSDTRAAQLYRLYGASESANGLVRELKKGSDPGKQGWRLIAEVDTRGRQQGGQHAVAISDSAGPLGRFRYLLLDVEPTEKTDPFGNTFFSEIDVSDANSPAPMRLPVTKPRLIEFASGDGKYRYSIDVSKAPDLEEWSESKLKPVIEQWYPKIVDMFPSQDFKAATSVRLRYLPDSQMRGIPAYASGAMVTLNADWFRKELEREACGATVHELVHVVQAYSRTRRGGGVRPPGWVTEGIPDYVRWFLYEPQKLGAEINSRNLASARYDASYRVSGNFLDWVAREYGKQVIIDLNTVARDGMYDPSFWKEKTGANEQELDDLWKAYHKNRLEAPAK